MKIKGSVEVRVINSRTKELKQIVKKDNLITNRALLNTLFWAPQGISRNISISTSTAEPSIFATALSNIIGTGYTPSGVTSPTYNAAFNPPFGQIQKRIDFTGTSRTFTTVGLTDSGSNSNQNNEAHAVYAYTKLDTTCTQGAYDYLDIFYRIQFLNSEGQGFVPQSVIDFGQAFMSLGGMNLSILYTSVCKAPVTPYANIYYGNDTGLYWEFQFGRARGWKVIGRIDSHYKFKNAAHWGLDGGSIGTDLAGLTWTASVQGWIFNSMLQGARNDGKGCYTCAPLQESSSPFQNLFSHSSTATVPFFDSLNLANGNGKVLIDGTWTNKWPELYRVSIVSSGAVGVSTYKWAVRKHFGFNGNTYNDRTAACIYRNPTAPAATGFHGWRDENNDVLRYSTTQIVQYDDTGVTLLDLMDGAYTNWNSSTTPELEVTQVRQCAVDLASGKIYVGCRNTGVWVIDVAASSITHPVTVSCYGIDVGRNGVAFALVNGGLYKSTDWNTALDFTYAGISDNNWSRVYYLKVDPEHADDQMALVCSVAGNSNRRIVWWKSNFPTGSVTAQLNYASSGDTNGAFYYIGTQGGSSSWGNPIGAINITASTIGSGSVAQLVDRANSDFYTNNAVNSFVTFDLRNSLLTVNGYAIKNRSGDPSSLLRNWKLRGSNDNSTWVDLNTQTNNATLTAVNQWLYISVPNITAQYRYFQILNTGPTSSSNNHLCLGEVELYGSLQYMYSAVSGPESTAVRPWPAAFDVSDTGSNWGCYGVGILTHGSATAVGSDRDIPTQQLTHSVWGSDRYGKVSFYKDMSILHSAICNKSGVNQNFYTSLGDRSFVLHMDGGVVLTNREMRQLFTDNSYCWEYYGWDGSTWVLNHNGARTTHETEEALNAGLTIKFQDGSNSPHFNASDFYTQGICWGTWKDPATTIYWESAWYSKPAQFQVDVPSGLTVPLAPTPTQYWRIRNTAAATGTTGNWSVRELVFKDKTGADIATGGTASGSASTTTAINAFDKSTTTSWSITGAINSWLQYTFATAVDVRAISIRLLTSSTSVPPTSYVVEKSTDNSTWTVVWSFTAGSVDNTVYDSSYTPYQLTLPVTSNADFVTMETDSPQLNQFTLNGTAIATLYVDGTVPPGPGEIRLYGNGKMEFNESNAGATLGGFFAYIKN